MTDISDLDPRKLLPFTKVIDYAEDHKPIEQTRENEPFRARPGRKRRGSARAEGFNHGA